MASRHVQLADAVAASLTTFVSGLPEPVAVERTWRIRQLADRLASTVVSVVPQGVETERADRSAWIDELTAAVVVSRSIDRDGELAVIDQVDALTESFVDHLRTSPLPGAFGLPRQVTSEAVLDQEALDNLAVYRGIVTLSYRTIFEA